MFISNIVFFLMHDLLTKRKKQSIFRSADQMWIHCDSIIFWENKKWRV